MMNDAQQHRLLDLTAAEIDTLSQRAFAKMLEDIRAGVDPQAAIRGTLRTFEGGYYAVLSKAFGEVLQRAVGVPDVRNWPAGDIALSTALYRNSRLVESASLAAIKAHAQGMKSLREVALDLYEGYGFRETETLDIQAKLPRYIREDAMLANKAARTIARFRANTLKTPALRAAYLAALDALEEGAAEGLREKALRVAYHERNRYFANRIAQTEIQRAYAAKKDGAMLEDDSVEFVQVRLSSTHPRADICDLHAKADLYGLGAGIYPKHLAPRRPFHNFCRCIIAPRFGLNGSSWRENPSGLRTYLNSLDEREAARVMGSRAKLQEALDGTPLGDILNKGVPEGYGYATLGEAFGKHLGNGAFTAALREHIDALLASANPKKQPFVLGALPANFYSMAAQLNGFNVEGKSLALDHDYTRHAFAHHGQGNEKNDAQIPIEADDFMRLVDSGAKIISVQPGRPKHSKNGAMRLLVALIIDGFELRVVLEQRRKYLVPYTLWKRQA